MIFDIILIVVGTLLLIVGTNYFVTNAVSVALSMKMSPLFVGLTIIAIGTSLPELVISGIAVSKSHFDLAISIIVGTCIINIGFFLAIGTIIMPSRIKSDFAREVPYVIIVTFLFYTLLYTESQLSRVEGFVLIAFFLLNMLYTILDVCRQGVEGLQNMHEDSHCFALSQRVKHVIYTLIALIPVVFGAKLVLDSTISLASKTELSTGFWGLTVVAMAASLPEITTTLMTFTKREQDLAFGNVIGSNIINLTLVAGASALINPLQIDPNRLMSIEFPALVFLTLFLWPLTRFRWNIGRMEGTVLFVMYFAFIFLLIQSNH